ncbi:hypothetical protein [Streptomyces sp. V3I7]|uniref:hypothetical protein n=1 Tax=Streptomyces sp. V3I7 TaxID=3042278 RepID=UPI00278467CF|nr:hypothetical protein [Streptomyces sp. V3I7]MDQ0992158.1 hypothetical protein [Streptomyces sp. V3I7]
MAFPQTPLDIQADLKIGGVWQNVTADVYTRDLMTITRGRPDEGARSDPGKCTLTFNNGVSKVNPAVTGRYSPGNPNSDLYGLIGRNTEVRVHVPAGSAHLELNGDASGYVSTPDTAALDITGDLDVRVELDADLTRGALNQTIIGKWGDTASDRSWILRVFGGYLQFHFVQASDQAVRTAFTESDTYGGRALRFTLDVNNGNGGWTLRFYQADSIDGPWTLFSGDLIGSGTPTLQTTSTELRIGPTDSTTTPPRQPFIGSGTRFQVRSGINGTLVADADFRPLDDGTTSFTDSVGRVWTVKGTAAVRTRDDRFRGEISAWPPRWDVSGKDAWTAVDAAGPLRRYGQGASALQSPLRRRLPTYSPLAYWPLEEGAQATQASSPLPGVQPLTLSHVNWGQADSLISSAPLPVLASSGGALAQMLGRIPGPAAPLTEWGVQWLFRLDQPDATTHTLMRILCTGTVAEWYIQVSSTGYTILAKDSDGSTLVSQTTGWGFLGNIYGTWMKAEFNVVQDGSNIDWHIGWVPPDGASGATNGSISGTVGRPTAVASPPDGWSPALDGTALGHITAWPADDNFGYENAISAWQGEQAGHRLQRLAREEDVPLTVRGVIAEEELMGSQRQQTLLDLLAECAASDGGIFMEQRSRPGLHYRDRATLYSQVPTLTLDYTADGEVGPPLEPVDDDADTVNDVTVTRIDGSSGRAVLEDGALSVQSPPDGVGRYESSVQLSLADDAQTEPIANWRLHLGTWDAPRYPVVHVNLAAAPHLIDSVLGVDQGDLIRITNPPRWLPAGDIDLIVQGYTESFDQYGWDIYFTCSPAGPWAVGAVGIVEDFSDTDYAVTITNGGNAPWTRSQLHYNTGTWSLRSGTITNNQTSDAIVSVPPGATELTFWYWTSSEASGTGFEGDRLLVLVDGVQVIRAQGTTPWTSATIDVTGASTVTFRYAKDASTAGGEDAVHIDDLTFTTQAPMRVDADPGTSTIAVAATSTAGQLVVHTPAARDDKLPAPWITSAGPAPTYLEQFPYDIKFGGETARVTACVPGAWDTFTRTASGAWGGADCGFAWVETGGSASDRSVNGSAGVITLAAAKDTVRFQRIIGGIADCEVLVRMSVDQIATGASFIPAVLLRYVDAANYYRARLHFNPGGGMLASVTRDTTLIGPTNTLPYTYTAGAWFWLRARLTGHRVQVRAWPDGQAEPGTWHSDQTITTAPIATGQIGLAGSSLTGNTNTNPQLRYDDYTIVTPQLMTVQRSRNGIVKGHDVGTEVRLARPAIVAL